MAFSGVLTATVLICFVMTLFMGLYAKLPFAVAPGMGINAFFTFTIILTQKVWWQVALGIVFWAGVLFLIISVTPIRETIAKAIPNELRIGTAAGHRNLSDVHRFEERGTDRVRSGHFRETGNAGHSGSADNNGDRDLGLAVDAQERFCFSRRNSRRHAARLGIGFGESAVEVFSAPDFQTVFFKLDILGALKLSLLPAIIAILFTDLFDSISTFIGVAHAADLLDEKGNPQNLKQGLIVDSFATLGAGVAGTSSGTAYIESMAGIDMGGRTGLDFGLHGALFSAVLLSGAARGHGAGLRDCVGFDSGRRIDVSQRGSDQLFENRRRACRRF